jgi:hypothetical protein
LFENILLGQVLCPENQEVTGEWKKFHSEELHDLYYLPNIIWVVKSKRIKWVEHGAPLGQKKNFSRFLVWKPEGNRSRAKCKVGFNIKRFLKK